MIRGCTRSFELLYERHAGSVHWLGRSVLRDTDAADELVQETFLYLWRGGAAYSCERASVRTWLLLIARNRAIDMLRARARRARAADSAELLTRIAAESPDALTEAIAREDATQLHAALALLPPAQRTAVVLAFGGGLTHVEVAERTGAALGTVKSRVRLAQRSMAERMEPGRRPTTARAV